MFTIEPLPKKNEQDEELFKSKLTATEIPTTPSVVPPLSTVVEPVRSVFRRRFIWLGAIVILLAVGAYFLLNGNSFVEARVSTKVSASAEVTSGDLVTYTVVYKNDNKVDLNDAKLLFVYPTDAQATKDGVPTGARSDTVDLGILKANTSGQQTFTAYVVGDTGNIKNATATLTFTPAGLRSEIKNEATHAATITRLPVHMSLVAPPTAVNGQAITYLIDYRNDGSTDFSNLRLILTYPQGFTPTKATPSATRATSNQNIWDIPTLPVGSAQRITITGTLRGIEREGKQISLVLQKSIDIPGGSQYIAIEKQDSSTAIATPYLSAFLKLNGVQDYTAHLGDHLQYIATIRNNTNVDLTGLAPQITLNGAMFDYASVYSAGFFDSRTRVISWNPAALSELATLRANQSIDIPFDVRLKPSFPTGSHGASDSLVKASFHVETPNVPPAIDLATLSADDELITRISTAPSFSQVVFLKDGQLGASGPYPPKVDQKTIFTVRWSIVNPSNALDGVKVTATLQPGVIWENKTRTSSALPAPVINQQLGTITWTVGTVSGGTGVAMPAAEAYFQVSITPSVNQVGQLAPLIKNIQFSGVDSLTKEQISRTANDTTTGDVSDATGGGTVGQ
ncbi:MAG: hypothetical protein A3A33_02540 [Candidatus Yanofskybacteria bacterium RIFCSPLOWO2_01_FULL_49_25]|uniref:DUF11 domain-containing protein n=1 Tax=Candidatus Yanofskybacteria bacterium RIFCSPLOWO2_01_FULL_49_25 TaxID=1802701 RepID=A0A1F8GUU8_9BACT|nr:MAG: hypothetical protein A3A33_02540 [Candidatus Yanofskybacteria bacterium RIFCSPLOWO2_01_FULL_49_25]